MSTNVTPERIGFDRLAREFRALLRAYAPEHVGVAIRNGHPRDVRRCTYCHRVAVGPEEIRHVGVPQCAWSHAFEVAKAIYKQGERPMPARLIFRVQHHRYKDSDGKKHAYWAVHFAGSLRTLDCIAPIGSKSDAVALASWLARGCDQPAQVVIHKRDGKIQEERTYPRSSDPRPTKSGKYRG